MRITVMAEWDASLLLFDLFQNLDDFLCQSFVVKNPRSNFLS